MRFGYDVAFHLCLLPKPHNNSLMEPTSTLTIFIIELTLSLRLREATTICGIPTELSML